MLPHSHLPSRTPDGLNTVARRGLARHIDAHARSAARSVVDLREERAPDVRVEVPARSSRSKYFNPFGVLGWPVPAASAPSLHHPQNAYPTVERLVRKSASPQVRKSVSLQVRKSASPQVRPCESPPAGKSASPPVRPSARPPVRPSNANQPFTAALATQRGRVPTLVQSQNA